MVAQDLDRTWEAVQESPGWIGEDARLWAVVLAGGQGMRLRPLTRRIHGEARPKQFAAVLGARSLLRQTLDRAATAIPLARTVAVTVDEHAGYVMREIEQGLMPRVLEQPADRGTAAGVLLPVHWVSRQDPEAIVVVLPSDHFIDDAERFMAHVEDVAAAARAHPTWVVLLGALADTPDTQYGWIEPGAQVGATGAGPIWRAKRFWEKPSPAQAVECLRRGCLWNTFVLVATARALVDLGRRYLPLLHARLAPLSAFFDTEHERWAIRQAYAPAPAANFSRAVLERCPPELMVAQMPALTWSDLGTPRRVLRLARRLALPTPWLARMGGVARRRPSRPLRGVLSGLGPDISGRERWTPPVVRIHAASGNLGSARRQPGSRAGAAPAP